MRGTGRRSAGHGEALLNRRGRRVKLASAHDPPQVGQRKPAVQRARYKERWYLASVSCSDINSTLGRPRWNCTRLIAMTRSLALGLGAASAGSGTNRAAGGAAVLLLTIWSMFCWVGFYHKNKAQYCTIVKSIYNVYIK